MPLDIKCGTGAVQANAGGRAGAYAAVSVAGAGGVGDCCSARCTHQLNGIEQKSKEEKIQCALLRILHETSRINVTDLFKGFLPVPPVPHFVVAPLY